MIVVAPSDTDTGVVQSLPVPPSKPAAAWHDLVQGAAKSWIWASLALQDIKLRYRGSLLGPFWLTISMLVMAGAMGLIYPRLFAIDAKTYLPYLIIGLVVWQFISGLVTEGCDTFLRAQSVIQQIPMPFSIHVYRTVCRNLLVLAHSFVVIPIGLIIFRLAVDWHIVETAAGLALLTLNGVWISILLGMLSARFRDIPPIVANFMQIGFFITPIFWPIDALGDWKSIAALNPLFAAIDTVRAPLLGVAVSETSWIVLLFTTVAGCGMTFALFARFRTRIAYWI
jgi:ABC-2 type transport system permease protein/lipopolysaccharide transport system permease protein